MKEIIPKDINELRSVLRGLENAFKDNNAIQRQYLIIEIDEKVVATYSGIALNLAELCKMTESLGGAVIRIVDKEAYEIAEMKDGLKAIQELYEGENE